MLCLREQICRNKGRICAAVCQNHHLRGAGRHINRDHLPANILLCRSHIPIAGAKNLIHCRNALRAIGHSCNCTCSANLKDGIHTAIMRSPKSLRIGLTLRICRCTHNNSAATCNLGRNGKHKHSGEERSAAARNIDTHALNRKRALHTADTRSSLHLNLLKALRLMKLLYISSSHPYGLLNRIGNQPLTLLQLLPGNGKRDLCRQSLKPCYLCLNSQNRPISTISYPLHNRARTLLNNLP